MTAPVPQPSVDDHLVGAFLLFLVNEAIHLNVADRLQEDRPQGNAKGDPVSSHEGCRFRQSTIERQRGPKQKDRLAQKDRKQAHPPKVPWSETSPHVGVSPILTPDAPSSHEVERQPESPETYQAEHKDLAVPVSPPMVSDVNGGGLVYGKVAPDGVHGPGFSERDRDQPQDNVHEEEDDAVPKDIDRLVSGGHGGFDVVVVVVSELTLLCFP